MAPCRSRALWTGRGERPTGVQGGHPPPSCSQTEWKVDREVPAAEEGVAEDSAVEADVGRQDEDVEVRVGRVEPVGKDQELRVEDGPCFRPLTPLPTPDRAGPGGWPRGGWTTSRRSAAASGS